MAKETAATHTITLKRNQAPIISQFIFTNHRFVQKLIIELLHVVQVRAEGPKGQEQHALKGQKLLAQGIALGIVAVSKAPCKGRSFVIFAWGFKAFALTGRLVDCQYTQGDALG